MQNVEKFEYTQTYTAGYSIAAEAGSNTYPVSKCIRILSVRVLPGKKCAQSGFVHPNPSAVREITAQCSHVVNCSQMENNERLW
jgi:hypothetical protein